MAVWKGAGRAKGTDNLMYNAKTEEGRLNLTGQGMVEELLIGLNMTISVLGPPLRAHRVFQFKGCVYAKQY